ncbi:hypothetical protein QYF36_011637 [Acer negundo]|nr:hypothetical protein QYF36_011637 [Acer negundo]
MKSDRWNWDVNWGAYNKKEDGATSVRMSDRFKDGRSKKRSFADVGDDHWLLKCAVGVLKRFDKVLRVNEWLVSIDIWFKSQYLGDKSILWRFEDELVEEFLVLKDGVREVGEKEKKA